jgi:hypothetical protein
MRPRASQPTAPERTHQETSTRFLPVDISKLSPDFSELDLFEEEEQREAIAYALQEVKPKDYQGRHPPEVSFEHCIAGEEMFPFIWESVFFKKRMYLKFCIPKCDQPDKEQFWLFSLHIDRPIKRTKK